MKPSPSQKIKERTLTGLDTIHERMKDVEGLYVSYAGFFEFTGGCTKVLDNKGGNLLNIDRPVDQHDRHLVPRRGAREDVEGAVVELLLMFEGSQCHCVRLTCVADLLQETTSLIGCFKTVR